MRFLSDLRALNNQLERIPFPIPHIQDTLRKLQGFTHATALDLNMGHYTIRIDHDATKLCAIVTPWGNTITYSYL